jgi:hypothetical protein
MNKGTERLSQIRTAATAMGCPLVTVPYKRGLTKLEVEKLVSSYEQGEVSEVVAIVPGRTDTQWWQALSDYPACFVTGRLSFDGKNGAPFPSTVFYFGVDLRKFFDNFKNIGIVKVCVQERVE